MLQKLFKRAERTVPHKKQFHAFEFNECMNYFVFCVDGKNVSSLLAFHFRELSAYELHIFPLKLLNSSAAFS